MTIRYIWLVLLFGSLATVSSCKKGDQSAGSKNPGCLLTEMRFTKIISPGTYSLSYNGMGQLIEGLTENSTSYTGSLYTYASNGELAKVETYKDQSKKVISKTEYTYGAEGLLEEKIFKIDNGILKHSTTIKYEYENGVFSRKNTYDVGIGLDKIYRYSLYTYNAQGDVSKIEYFQKAGGGNWQAYYYDSFTYTNHLANKHLIAHFVNDPTFPAKHYFSNILGNVYDPSTKSWLHSGNSEYSYEFDNEGKLSRLFLNGGPPEVIMTWNCQ